MKKCFLSVATIALTFLVLASCSNKKYTPNISTTVSPQGTNLFKPDTASIAQNYTIPAWFTNAKLGIFIHYGVYTVPAYGSEWYARKMYSKEDAAYDYHRKKYGPQDKFGYKDFIPMFKAPKFNADEWVEIFKDAGAKYVVPVAEHHDGFAMYRSAWNKWNAYDMGPHKDFIGELSKSIKAQGLKFGVSNHRAENAWFYNGGMEFNSDVQDTTLSLYGARVHEPEGKGMTAFCGKYPGSTVKSRQNWLRSTYELIDLYKPDLIWFDWTVGKYPFQPTFYKFMAYYYNNATDWHKEVVVNTKVGYGDNIQVFDIERGKSNKIRKYPWQTDTSVGTKSWSYTPSEVNKTPDHIIDDFVDIVSKNGNLLLNVGPKLEGTITKEQQHVLHELGRWLKVNGEAIYSSRPWVRASEGNKGTSGYMTDNAVTKYTANDKRFTTKGDTLFITLLGEEEKSITVRALSKEATEKLSIKSVSLLGSDQKIDWKLTAKGLHLTLPTSFPTQYAHTFKVELSGIFYGNLQTEVKGNSLLANTYVRNSTDEEITRTITGTLDGKKMTKEVTIPAHQTIDTEFNFAELSETNHKAELKINNYTDEVAFTYKHKTNHNEN